MTMRETWMPDSLAARSFSPTDSIFHPIGVNL
jgi:hypothetical protein